MPSTTKKPSLLEEHFEAVEEDDEGIGGSDASSASELSEDEHENTKGKSKKKVQAPRKRHAEAFWNRESLADEDSLPLGERAALRKPWEVSRDVVKHGQGGSREISFNPRSSSKYKEYDEDEEARPGKRRGIQSLKLSGSRGRGGRGRGGFRGRNRGRGRR
ncbi:hypothetical protein Sango_0846200 [Sesamum angolense]|uniref:Uncharacterized protein n=1 Tax=Sesamum angolense TaxID=2727404 RepID=A0AAE1X446_9LAMI|nr:hypothetical protein Sango_0846200 [Sesamum angolense]